MAGDINRVVIVGRLTRDAELTYTSSDFALTKFSVALNQRKKQNDQWIDHAHFFDVLIWGKRGEALNQYLTRGQQVAVEGELRQERWQDKNTQQNRSKISIECTNIQLVGGKKDGNSQGNYNSGPQRNNNQQSNSQPFDQYKNGGGFDDDIPF